MESNNDVFTTSKSDKACPLVASNSSFGHIRTRFGVGNLVVRDWRGGIKASILMRGQRLELQGIRLFGEQSWIGLLDIIQLHLYQGLPLDSSLPWAFAGAAS